MTRNKIAPLALSGALLFASTPSFALCVDVPKANLRQGPGTQYEKSWQVYEYMPFKKIGARGNWLQVEDVDGDRHWILGNLVSERVRCAVVRANKANVRTGPGTQHAASSLGPVEKYYSFRVLEVRGDWVKVSDVVFDEAWVARHLLWMP